MHHRILKWQLMLLAAALGSANPQDAPPLLKRIGVLNQFGCPIPADSPSRRRRL